MIAALLEITECQINDPTIADSLLIVCDNGNITLAETMIVRDVTFRFNSSFFAGMITKYDSKIIEMIVAANKANNDQIFIAQQIGYYNQRPLHCWIPLSYITLLLLAYASGWVRAVKVLLEADAYPNAFSNLNSNTAFHFLLRGQQTYSKPYERQSEAIIKTSAAV